MSSDRRQYEYLEHEEIGIELIDKLYKALEWAVIDRQFPYEDAQWIIEKFSKQVDMHHAKFKALAALGREKEWRNAH